MVDQEHRVRLNYNLLERVMNFCENTFLIVGGGLTNDFLDGCNRNFFSGGAGF